MTGFLNTHGTYPHIEHGQLISFPNFAWEDDMLVTGGPAKTWRELEEIEVIAKEESCSEWDELHPDVWIGWTEYHETWGSIRPRQPAHDKYHELADQHCVETTYSDEEGGHFANMAIEGGLCPREDVNVYHEEDQLLIIEAWIRKRYGLDNEVASDSADDIGEAYEHLSSFEVRRHMLMRAAPQHWMSWDAFEELESRRDHNNFVRTQKGKPSRFNKRNRVCQDHIRSARRDTERQMDTIWLWYMTESGKSDDRMIAERFLDAHVEFDQVYEEYTVDDIVAERHENSSHHLEQLDEPEYDFWGSGYYQDYPDGDDLNDDYANLPPEELYADPMDRYEFGILTQEDFEFFDAEQAAEEAAADALEAEFEHLPVGFATGRRMQLAARAA